MSIFNKIKPVPCLDQFSCRKSETINKEIKKAELMAQFATAVAAITSPPCKETPKITHHEW